MKICYKNVLDFVGYNMARPIKSKAIKSAQGTLKEKKGVINLNLQPLESMPSAPDEFNTDEKWFFNTVCEALFNANLLRGPDLMTIQGMAGWWAIMKESQKVIRKDGFVQTASTGYQNVSPAVVTFEKAWNKLKDFTDRYGFNLLSKDKITAPPSREKKDDWLQNRIKTK